MSLSSGFLLVYWILYLHVYRSRVCILECSSCHHDQRKKVLTANDLNGAQSSDRDHQEPDDKYYRHKPGKGVGESLDSRKGLGRTRAASSIFASFNSCSARGEASPLIATVSPGFFIRSCDWVSVFRRQLTRVNENKPAWLLDLSPITEEPPSNKDKRIINEESAHSAKLSMAIGNFLVIVHFLSRNRCVTRANRLADQSSMVAATSPASSTFFSSASLNFEGLRSIVTLAILPVNLLSPCL